MDIIALSSSELNQHIRQSKHRYFYFRIRDAILEVIFTPDGIFQASFVSEIPTGSKYHPSIDLLCYMPLLCTGTPFQLKVWQAAQAIPAGVTVTYQDIAQGIGHAQAYRAVGTALGTNRLAYLIPCHRVIKKDGGIGNYRWGREVKEGLLRWN